jgi:hypothetical protein
VKASFVSFFTNLIYAELVAGAPWIAAWPIVGNIARWIIERAVTFAATKGGLVAFMINSKVFTTDQARDYTKALEKLHQLPDHVSDAEWEKAEDEANHSFGNLFNWTA